MGSDQPKVGHAGRLAGKRSLVTGGAQGIGRAISRAFANEGAHVCAADLSFDGGLAGKGLDLLELDVTDEIAIQSEIDSLGPVDVLVNCVGLVVSGSVLDSALDDLDRSYRVNVRSMAAMIRAVLPGMLAKGGGSIINIASVVSTVMAAPNRFAYGTTKAAVIGLTMSVAMDFIKSGVRCNAISPGTVDTPSLHDRWHATGNAAAAREAFIARQPMGRLGMADEIAATAVLLATDEARFMTGSNIIIDGGMSL